MRRFAAALIVLVAVTTTVLAEDHDVLSGWEFDVMPYAWIPGVFGTVGVAGRTAQVEVTTRELLDIVFDGDGLAAGGYFAARHDRWNVFLDAFGGSIKAGVRENVPTQLCTLNIAADLTIKPVIVDAAVGYTLGRWTLPQRTKPISLGAYAGMRFTHLGNHLRASAGVDDATKAAADVSKNFNWADPMIGIDWAVPLLETLSLDFRADIGGFGASSKLIWGIVGDFRYTLPWKPLSTQPWVAVGYRVVAFDHEFAGTNAADLQFRGPLMGIGFTF
jgi:hypothetical protein